MSLCKSLLVLFGALVFTVSRAHYLYGQRPRPDLPSGAEVTVYMVRDVSYGDPIPSSKRGPLTSRKFGEALIANDGGRYVYRYWEPPDMYRDDPDQGRPLPGMDAPPVVILGGNGKSFWIAFFHDVDIRNRRIVSVSRSWRATDVYRFESIDAMHSPFDSPIASAMGGVDSASEFYFMRAILHNLADQCGINNLSSEDVLGAVQHHELGKLITSWRDTDFAQRRHFIRETGTYMSFAGQSSVERQDGGAWEYLISFPDDEHSTFDRMICRTSRHLPHPFGATHLAAYPMLQTCEIIRVPGLVEVAPDEFMVEFYADEKTRFHDISVKE